MAVQLKAIRRASFGPWLRDWRLSQGYTQTELGVLLGIDQTTLSQWELGNQTPRIILVADEALVKEMIRKGVTE